MQSDTFLRAGPHFESRFGLRIRSWPRPETSATPRPGDASVRMCCRVFENQSMASKAFACESRSLRQKVGLSDALFACTRSSSPTVHCKHVVERRRGFGGASSETPCDRGALKCGFEDVYPLGRGCLASRRLRARRRGTNPRSRFPALPIQSAAVGERCPTNPCSRQRLLSRRLRRVNISPMPWAAAAPTRRGESGEWLGSTRGPAPDAAAAEGKR